ncbi:MAG: hypothetical protein ACWGOX_11650 [Desulforhopalus sp.]
MASLLRMLLIPFVIILFSFPVFAQQSETFTGKIRGINCQMQHLKCDSAMYRVYHVQYEPDFVLVLPDGKHYMLPNVPRDVKVRIAGETATVSGNTDPAGLAINVERLSMDGQVVWSQKMQRAMDRKRHLEEFNQYGGGN